MTRKWVLLLTVLILGACPALSGAEGGIFPAAAETAVPETWVCPVCGGESCGMFCPWCGTKKPEPVMLVCPDCGTAYDPDSGFLFCMQCGAKLPAATPAATAQPVLIIATAQPILTMAPDSLPTTVPTFAPDDNLYAGATPAAIDPIDRPTPTPLPKIIFSYTAYEASALHLAFEGPAGWIPDETAPDVYTLTNPDASMDYAAQITIRTVPVGKQYGKNELTKEVKGAMDTLRSDMGFSKFDSSKTASRDFINGKGVYMAFTGTLKEGGVKVAGRIMVNCVDKTLYILTCTYPGSLADIFAEGVYNKARATMKIRQ